MERKNVTAKGLGQICRRQDSSWSSTSVIRLSASQSRACDFPATLGAVLILPHRIGPPLGYGKRRADDGKEALQA